MTDDLPAFGWLHTFQELPHSSLGTGVSAFRQVIEIKVTVVLDFRNWWLLWQITMNLAPIGKHMIPAAYRRIVEDAKQFRCPMKPQTCFLLQFIAQSLFRRLAFSTPPPGKCYPGV